MAVQRRTNEILTAMLELSQQQASAVLRLCSIRWSCRVWQHAQQMTEMRAQTAMRTVQIHQQHVAFQQAQHEHQQASA